MDKFLARLIKKRERERKTTTRKQGWKLITTDPIEIKRMLWRYYEQLYAKTFENLDKIISLKNKRYSTQGEEKILIVLLKYLLKKLNVWLKTFPQNKLSGGFTDELLQTFKKEIIPVLQNLYRE